MSAKRVIDLLAAKRVIVVCGAGGVGKTTSSAALALAAARAGRRVLVITIDPSRRLAQTLGVSAHAPEPVELDRARQRTVEIEPPGSLSAWMLDPQAVTDRTVRKLAPDPERAEMLLRNPVYRNVAAMVAGMQEYTAVEALHGYVQDDRYDLIVLDTPPSRDALRFLETPARGSAFLDRRILTLFVPGAENPIRRAATRVIEAALDRGLGRETRTALQGFFARFADVFRYLNRSQSEMREFFTSRDAAFLLVSSPAREALEEAYYFERKTQELGLPLAGYLLNRSLAFAADRPMPSEALLPEDAPAAARSALAKLAPLATAEAKRVARHAELLHELEHRTRHGFAHALPELPAGASTLESLAGLLEGERPLNER